MIEQACDRCAALEQELQLALCPVCDMMYGSDAPGIFCLACAEARAVLAKATP